MINKIKELPKTKRIFAVSVIILLILSVLAGVFVGGVNAAVVLCADDMIITAEKAAELKDVDCIIVLGCQVKQDGTPSVMLNDRIITASHLYDLGVSNRLLMSGDGEKPSYNETSVMKKYAIQNGAAESDIQEDRYGLCTYDSIYRAAAVYGYDKIVIVTQKYHLYRALYIARSMGIEAYGVSATLSPYGGQRIRDIREIAARTKDFALCIFKPSSKYIVES